MCIRNLIGKIKAKFNFATGDKMGNVTNSPNATTNAAKNVKGDVVQNGDKVGRDKIRGNKNG